MQGYIWDANCIAHNHTLLRAAWSLICLGRKKTNRLKELAKEDGYVVQTQEDLKSLAEDHFTNLFARQNCNNADVISIIHPCISEEDNCCLTTP